MKNLLSIFFLMVAKNALAFHQVSEVLPGGKILICKDLHQERKGDVVQAVPDGSRFSKIGDAHLAESFALPAVGSNVYLEKSQFLKRSDKLGSNASIHDVGSATIIAGSVEGEERIKRISSSSRVGKTKLVRVKITKDEAKKIADDCLVALPTNTALIHEKTSVRW